MTERILTPYDGTRAIAEEVIREDIKACMKGLCHPNLEWSKAVRLAADFLALSAPSETKASAPALTADKGQQNGLPDKNDRKFDCHFDGNIFACDKDCKTNYGYCKRRSTKPMPAVPPSLADKFPHCRVCGSRENEACPYHTLKSGCPYGVPMVSSNEAPPSATQRITCEHGVVGYCEPCALRDPGEVGEVTEDMVNRFLSWPLPDSVCSDPCATKRGYPHRIGTNLLTADEARQMLEHVLLERRVRNGFRNPERRGGSSDGGTDK